MAYRARGGGGYTRGNRDYRQHGRSSGSPYQKPRQPSHQQETTDLSTEIIKQDNPESSPVRDSIINTMADHPPANGNRQIKKFSNKARLFVANLPRDTSETQFKEMFKPFGEVQEVFLQKDKSFGMCRMAYREDAEKAIAALNGSITKGRDIKVRFATSNSSVKVEHLHHMVSNELLRNAFLQFGEVEDAIIVVDGRGRSKGYGIVEFATKRHATNAISQCSNKPFLITRNPIPVVVSEYVKDNEDDGISDDRFQKGPGYYSERELEPRFANPGDLEFVIASRWKSVFEEERAQRKELEDILEKNRANVEDQLKSAHNDHETELLRRELAHHQEQQMRLMQRLNQRDGRFPPSLGGHPPIPPPGMTPLFPGDHSEGPPHLPPSQINIPGLGGLLPPGGMPLFPRPLMGQPGYDNYH